MRVLFTPKRFLFCFMPNSSPTLKFTMLLVLRLFLNLPMVFSWSLLLFQQDVVGLSDDKILI